MSAERLRTPIPDAIIRPRALDLYCKAGGMTRGLQLAGWHVTGNDREPQPHYVGDAFILGDALTIPLDGYDAIFASPPCQHHAITQNIWHNQDAHPDLIEPTRARLRASGLPYVIENVPRAPLLNPVMLCGESFGLGVIRHRLFESNVYLFQPEHRRHRGRASYGHSPTAETVYMTISGHWSGFKRGCEAMGIDWMTRDEMSQAIPPAYGEWVGTQVMAALRAEISA